MLCQRICTRSFGRSIIHSRFLIGNRSDPYTILGVKRDATDKEIKNAFLKKCKELHPDVNASVRAAQDFMVVKDAYNAIGRSEDREKLKFAEDIARKTGFEDHLKSAMGSEAAWKPDFDLDTEKMERLRKERVASQNRFKQQVYQEQFGKKADTSQFQDWEKQHFEDLGNRRSSELYGVGHPRREMTTSDKRHAMFIFAVLAVLFVITTALEN